MPATNTISVYNEEYVKLMKIQHKMEEEQQKFVSMAEVIREVMKK